MGWGVGVPRPERCENIFSPSEKRVRKRPTHRTGALPIETSGYGIEGEKEYRDYIHHQIRKS